MFELFGTIFTILFKILVVIAVVLGSLCVVFLIIGLLFMIGSLFVSQPSTWSFVGAGITIGMGFILLVAALWGLTVVKELFS